MKPLPARASTLLLVLALSVACASAPRAETSSAAQTRDQFTPPVRLRDGMPPNFRGEARLSIQVMIGADGVPDMRTLRVSGTGAGDAHAAIEEWVRTSAFEPARRNGVPVAALMKMTLQSNVIRR